MKTEIVCPNKNDPAWKILVNAIGEPRAYLTFFRNHNVIPDVTTARVILGLKEERDLKVAATPAALAGSGVPQSGMKYAVKNREGRHVAVPNFRDADTASLPFPESVPGVEAKLKAPNTADEKFEDVVKSAQNAADLVLVY